jgi:DNA-binding transcriptional LysR family regulator
VSAPTLFAQIALGRIGARFALAYPEVRLEIVAEDRRVDLVDDGYDLVIRVDPAPDQLLVGRPFLRDERLIVASPEVGRPARPKREPNKEIPVRAVLISATRPDVLWQMRTENRALIRLRPEPVLQLSSLSMVRDAVVAGVGAALLPKMLVADDIASGRLVQWGRLEGLRLRSGPCTIRAVWSAPRSAPSWRFWSKPFRGRLSPLCVEEAIEGP